ERREDRAWSEEWAPYTTAKAELLLDRGELDEAAATLSGVHRLYQTRWAFAHASERLARSRSTPAPALTTASLATSAWRPGAWLYAGPEAPLELVAERDAPGLRLRIDVAPSEGSVVEASLDGAV